MPTFPTWLFYVGMVFTVVPFLLFYLLPDPSTLPIEMFGVFRHSGFDHVVTMVGLTLAGLVLTAGLLRAIVYFRDTYRATNYGAPDLVQIIRAIDTELGKLQGRGRQNDVQLSFIGHSMGGFVVTNTLRVLSNVFERPVSALNSYGAYPYPEDEAVAATRRRHIGNAFVLKRFVLASPDIPAETLLSSRGNFLASMLSHFDEAYLFCNEGDEVLRQI
jgi:pimeloyl-ACP methyl ester carboxylesterase